MLFRWLTTEFPRDMQRGWLMIRADLAFWCSLAALLALLSVTPLAEHGNRSDSFSAVVALGLTTLLGVALAPLVFVIAAARFAAVRGGHARSWASAVAMVRRRFMPVMLAWLAAAVLARAGSIFAKAVVVAAFQTSGSDINVIRAWAELVGGVIFVGLLVRFAFVPFLASLHRAEEFQGKYAPLSTLGQLANRFAWPLVQSRRMTGDTWRELLPYLILYHYAPAAAAEAPGIARPVLSFALHVLSFTALAVLFHYYAERARPAGAELASSLPSPACS
jgi:hypothetical protein